MQQNPKLEISKVYVRVCVKDSIPFEKFKPLTAVCRGLETKRIVKMQKANLKNVENIHSNFEKYITQTYIHFLKTLIFKFC